VRYVVLVVGICGVASAALLARYGLDAGVSATALSAWRLIVASLGLVLFQLIRPPTVRLQRRDIWRVAVAGIFLAIHFATWIASLEYVSVARSTLLVATSPLWAGLLGLFIPDLRPRPIFWTGLALAAVGTLLVTSQGLNNTAGKGPPWVGDLLAAIGAIAIVPYLLFSQSVQARSGTLVTITWIYSAAAGALVLLLTPLDRMAPPTSPQAWLSILGMAVFAQMIGHSSLNLSLRYFSTAQVAATTLLEPIFAAALAWVFLGERLTSLQGLGAVVMLIGVGLTLSRPDSSIGCLPERSVP
jgi:drug/metabolite transporter (DMT)-like permease